MSYGAFHHVELFRLRPGVPISDVRAAREALGNLVETLPGVLSFAVTDNLAERNAGFTMALFSAFADRRAYDIFTRHPEYQRVREQLLEPVVADRIVAQGDES